MMGLRSCGFLAMIAMAGQARAQAVPKPVYVQSFHKGPTRVAERTIVANLNTENPNYQATIKDRKGNDRYQLSLVPHRVDEEDARILSWRVQLIDAERRYLGNLLVASQPAGQLSDAPQDRSWWLDPNPYAVVPLLAKRVFKVDNFYCIVQVKEHHLLVPERSLVDSMKVEVRFTEADPLSD